MDKLNQQQIWSTGTLTELIGDLFCFEFILEIKRRLTNEEAKAYVGDFLRILAPIYIHEIANALNKLGIIPKDSLLSPDYQKRINKERQQAVHKVIVASEDSQKALEAMEINLSQKVYDINIVVKNGVLYDLNFEHQVTPLQDLDFWNFLFRTPRIILTAALSAVSPNVNLEDTYVANNNRLNLISSQLDNALSFSRYSYSTYKLFQYANTLEDTDKIFILYRYRMVTSVRVLSECFSSLCDAAKGFNIDYFFRKYRALVIEIIGNEMRQLKTPFSDQIKQELEVVINDPSFYRLNRKLRNNLHYETTNVLSESELKIVQTNQQNYLTLIENHFCGCLHLDIDKECKTMTGFSAAFRASGISKEELNKYYYWYYTKYLITGKL